jgi:hypothetical protein
MSILLGVLLVATIALLLVLVPMIALQLTRRLFGPRSARRRAGPPSDHGQRSRLAEPGPRPLGLFRAAQ